jgi:hypothetical protein
MNKSRRMGFVWAESVYAQFSSCAVARFQHQRASLPQRLTKEQESRPQKYKGRRFGKTIEDKNDVCPCCVAMTKCGHTPHCRRQSGRMESALPAHCCFMRGRYK